jgi:hypothetical protein
MVSKKPKEKIMRRYPSTSQKIGLGIFAFGAIYMIAVGWMYSWRVVPSANQVGSAAYSGILGMIWALSFPLGAFIASIGAALVAKAERRVVGLLIVMLGLFTAFNMFYSSGQMVGAIFGIGGGLITIAFLGTTWSWVRNRPSLERAGKTGSDLRMVGYIFFVIAAWYLCGLFGVGNFVLRPELADKFSITTGSTISLAYVVLVSLVVGWVFSFAGQLAAHPSKVVVPIAERTPDGIAAD